MHLFSFRTFVNFSLIGRLHLSKALFGTATDANVQEVKNQLRAFGATNRKVVHYVSGVVGVKDQR